MLYERLAKPAAVLILAFALTSLDASEARGQHTATDGSNKDLPWTPAVQLSKFRPATISGFQTKAEVPSETEEKKQEPAEEGGEGAEEGEGKEAESAEEDAEDEKSGEDAEGKSEEEGREERAEGVFREEGSESEAGFSESDVQVAWMLLGSVSFVMGLLYLVNWSDDDIRRYSWKVISTTISIFLAVLLFQGFNEVLLLLVEGYGEKLIAFFQIIHCTVYIVVLQFTIAVISGAICEKDVVDFDKEVWVINDPLCKDHGSVLTETQVLKVRRPEAKRSAYEDQYGMEVPVMKVKKELDTRMLRMKCYARLLAHMAGFAAINAGGTMQNLSFFRQRPLMALLPIVITQLFIMILFNCFGYARKMMMDRHMKEGRAGRRAKMFSEEVGEAENDISALSTSFLLVQVLRFAITNVLPNAEGLEEPETNKTSTQIGILYGLGFVFAMIAVLSVHAIARMNGDKEEDEREEETMSRYTAIALNASAMTFAWCGLWSTRWLFFNIETIDVESIMGRVVMALLLSLVVCFAIFGLDTIDDSLTDAGTDSFSVAQAIKMMVNALSILIGFSWEHSFDGGVAAVASTTSSPATVKFFLGLLITGAMTPMWLRHILEKEMSHVKLKQDRDSAKRRISRHSLIKNGNASP